jgi:hypothetical protein
MFSSIWNEPPSPEAAQPRLPPARQERRNLATTVLMGAPKHFQFAGPGRHERITHRPTAPRIKRWD